MLAPLLIFLQLTQAQELVARARAARYQQDSALAYYQAVVKQRMTGGIGVAPGLRGGMPAIGRVRLAARIESVARVGWHHELGAWAEILAERSVLPFIGMREPRGEPDDVALTLPYFPGRDRLWPMTELNDALHEQLHREGVWIEHPLDAGADSIYRLTLGDSITFRLPDQSTVHLREIRVRPRRADERFIVGSLWVDVASGALVRAAYRPSLPVDLWPFMESEMDVEDREKAKQFGPFRGNIQEIVVEHGLYQGRFWLPRARIATGEGTARGGRVTVSIQQTFTYEKVTALPAGVFAHVDSTLPDRDPRDGRIRRPVWRGVDKRTSTCRATGDSGARWSPDSLLRDSTLTVMFAEGARFRVLVPCDTNEMVNSKLLPSSIYDRNEEMFTETDFAAIQRDAQVALSMDRQADWSPQRWQIHFGLQDGSLRYNRVEGLSIGASADRILGDGYRAIGSARLGLADLQPNAEATIERSNMRVTMDATAYRRLAAANTWGNPMGIGSSLVAFVFGRDEGLFYRALGVETKGVRQTEAGRASLAWRVFAERDDSAIAKTHLSVAHALNGVEFKPNISAREGLFAGASSAITFGAGMDPRQTRVTGIVRADAVTGVTSFGRMKFETTVSRGFAESLVTALTLSAGTSTGALPPQHLWYLGGPQSVHGHAPGDMAGDAYWLGRLELSRGHPLVGVAVFADVGWAGPRSDWTHAATPMRGVGAGVYLLDGLIRLDVSRGLEPGSRLRGDVFVEYR